MESQASRGIFNLLHIEVVLDSLNPPAWIASALQTVREAGAQLQVSIVPSPARLPLAYLFKRYLEWDGARTPGNQDPLAPVSLELPVGESSSLPDLVLWFSDTDPLRAPYRASRLGTWFFHHGSAGVGSSRTAYFPELAAQQPVVSIDLLQRSTPEGPAIVLGQAHAASEIGWSLSRQRVTPLWKAGMLLYSALLRHQSRAPSTPAVTSQTTPTNVDVLRFAARNLARTVHRRFRYSNKESHWFTAYRTNRQQFVAQAGRFVPRGFRPIEAPHDHFYADPFVFTWEGRTFLFVEDYLYAARRGVLSVLELQADGTFGPATEILNRPYHLSYPFVFAYQGEVYLLPETLEAGRIELYRARQMPHDWELVKVLQENVAAVDTTLWIEGEVFYFFTNIARPGMTPNDLLYLFTSDSPTGEWRPHPANPVNLDVRAARGAGKLFRMGDKLVRPAQDCSVRYGYATQLNEVEVLTPNEFREKPLFRIEPDWAPGLIGTHTINSNDRVEVIDGQVYRTKYQG